ncbi:MAG: ATP-dependent sacrificial sulfur transferase LarE [PVC group bacterium]|nr:ATP-dependent sacrificial sulfur transferase LarE [PVC group bacterium]
MMLEEKFEKLKSMLASMQSILIAYSGGVDSAFLLKAASLVVPDSIMAVTAESPTYPSGEKDNAKEIANNLGIRHILVKIDELANPDFVKNNKDRCYWCKKELFTKFLDIAKEENLKYVVEASNYDDTFDYRPGLKAVKELEIRSPLIDLKFTKDEIREVSKSLGLSTWSKPSMACLSSRFPYGTKITEEALNRIDKAEMFLRQEGFSQVRVRHYDDLARIEVPEEELPKLLQEQTRKKIIAEFKKFGYVYVTIDIEGYRSGSMNLVDMG